MDEKIFSKEILGKDVVTDVGTICGRLVDLVFDVETGAVVHLIVQPDDDDVPDDARTDADNRIVLDCDIISIGEEIVVAQDV